MTDPTSLIKAADASHPAFRYVRAIAGVAAIVIVFIKFGVNLGTIVFGTIVVLCLTVFFVVFVRISKMSHKSLDAPAAVALWSVLTLILATIVLLFTSAFFDQPLPLRTRLLGQQGDSNIRGTSQDTSDSTRKTFLITDLTPDTLREANASDGFREAERVSDRLRRIVFTISNAGQQIMIVEAITLEIVSFTPRAGLNGKRSQIVVPDSLKGVHVRLSSDQFEYRILKDVLRFSYGEIDKLVILTSSEEPGEYLTVLKASWYPVGKRSEKKDEMVSRYKLVF